MRVWWTVIVIGAVLMTLGLSACGHEKVHDEDVSMSVPIHMEVPTQNLQPKIGLSGFIFGTFLLLTAYLVIMGSCVLLAVKEATFTKLTGTLRMVMQMLNPGTGEGKTMGLLNLLSHGETRVQIGAVGLVIGVVLAYLGTWIAL